MAPTPPDRSTVSSPVPPEARYEQLWEAEGPPDLSAFLARTGHLAPGQLAAVLCVDQRLRWKAGEQPTAQGYFDQFPAVAADSAAAVDLVFNEYLLRDRFGPPPDAAEFAGRYPAQAAELETQVAFHAAVGRGLTDRTDSTWSAGRLVGRYRLGRPLGKGGMGTVFLAEDAELGRLVALKVPHAAAWADPVGEARFIREARAAAALRHPHLCPIYDFGRAAGRCFFTMPFLQGETLRDRLAAGRPDPRTAVD
jgi:serine/threonine-protein kinase